jgi:hypothetical protein
VRFSEVIRNLFFAEVCVRIKAASLMLGVGILFAAAPAAAQSTNLAGAAPVISLKGVSFLPDNSAPAQPASDASASFQGSPTTHTMGDRQVFLRVQGGLDTCCSNTGFVIGVGVSGQPKSLENVEVTGDVSFGRFASTNDVYFSFNGLYDFHLQGHDAMPYAGAGLGIFHASANGLSDTQTDLQILGGVQLPVNGPRVVRFEIRFLFTTETTTFFLGSFTF